MKSLRQTLNLMSICGIGAAAAMAAVTFWGDQKSDRAVAQAFAAKDVVADILPPPMYLIELRLVLSRAAEGTLDLASAQAEAQRLEKEYGDRVTYWTQNPPYGLEAQLLGAQHESAQAFLESGKTVLKAVAAGDAAATKSALESAHAAYNKHRAGVDDTVKVANAFAEQAIAGFQSTGAMLSWLTAGLLGAAVAGLVTLGLWSRKSIMALTGGEPSRVADIANAVAAGDLSVKVELASGDTSSAMAAMAKMCSSLSSIVAQVRGCSDVIANGATQIAAGNMDLSHRTEEQASNLQSTASAMEQISSTIGNNADSARQATSLAASASSVAERGGAVVGEVVETMQAITDSSRKINDIIGVIDGIAFQTNILALNAAVEAARAGEQGRGFAVVASEVRTLAQRSAQAAKEIKTLIGSSVEKVEAGAKLVADAGATMAEIVQQVKNVTALIGEISNATTEQTQGARQVGEAMTMLDQTTQQNTALVEESAAAAENLSHQAKELVDVVRVFKLARSA